MKILIFTLLTVEISVAQLLTEQTSKNSNCFGGVLKGNCSDPNDRAFVKLISAGVKYSDRYNATLCTPYWTATIPPECCVQEPNDCYGEYSVVANNSYNYHKDCIGKNKCSQRLAAQMDILYLTSCDHNLYPSQTTYMDVELYCINVNNITPLNNGNKQNNGQGSTLYLWSGDSSTYSELTVATRICSVETDCDGEISVLSLDFRFADDNMNLTCIEDNVLTVTDGSRTDNFTCSSNNNFEIKTLYTSSNNYITITYTGTTVGGYLWLGFQTSTNGNLTINCQSPGQIYTCETSTTEEPTTTEQETTQQQTTTPEATTSLQSTTNETTTTGSLTSTEDQTFTTDNSSTTTDKETSGKSESPSSGNNTAMIAGIAAAIIIIILLVIAGFVYKKIIQPWRAEVKKKKEQHQSDTSPNSNTNVIKQGNGLPAIQSTRDNVSSGSTRSLLMMENSIQPMENNTVPKETKSESSKDLIDNEQDNNVKQITSIKNMEHSEPVPVELSKNTSQTQLAPLTPQLIQDQEKRKKKKKKKKHMKNKVEDIDNELQANGFSASAGNEAVIENINENGEHSKKQKKKKKKTKTHEKASELNEQENSGETHERKEKKKKKKKRKERQSEDIKQEEENTTIITQTIEEENDTW